MTRSRDAYEHSGAFVLRTPLLPFATLDAVDASGTARAAWESGGDVESAVRDDLDALRDRLRDLLRDSAIREAVFLASPSLDERLDRWLAGTDPDPDEAVRPLLSYVTRMAGRATPFGLFAGCSVGTVGGPTTDLTLPERARVTRHTRLDYGFLAKVVTTLQTDPAVQPYLNLRPNSSLYRAGGLLRMAEARVDDRGVRYHRVTFEEDEFLTATLDRAKDGARLADLAAALVDDEVTYEEAEEYVREIVDTQLLVSDLGPAVTGDAAVPTIVKALADAPETAGTARALDQSDRDLAALDAQGLGNDRARYEAVAERLRTVDPDLRLDRLFQVDLAKPGPDLTLGDDVVHELYRAVDVLHPLWRSGSDDLSRFREAFVARYEQREVPLAEALDEEIGVGYGPAPALAAEGAPLLAGLVPGGRTASGQPWTNADDHLLRLLTTALTDGRTEVVLTAADLKALSNADPLPLPDAFSIGGIVARHDDGVRLVVQAAVGPSGAKLLGRFCHLDEGIAGLVLRHVQAEEQARPDAVFAEVVHLPEGRVGNVLARPVLREHEIPFLAASGVTGDGRIGIDDLLVSVVGERVVLRSKRLGREVLPRITNAHNHQTGALAIYRFLGALQYQGYAAILNWSWGALSNAPYLPRVTYGRLVLSRAQWTVGGDDLKDLRDAKTAAARFQAVQALRERVRLPRRVVVSVGDNDLPVDLDRVGGGELFAHEARRGGLRLVELYPGPDELPVSSPEGRFAHEIVLPVVRRAPVGTPRWSTAAGADDDVFPPGSEWLSAKLYGGKATADAVLRTVVAPLVESTVGAGLADGWFFLRYGDPDQHLRVRLHGDPARLAGDVLPRLRDLATPLLADGRVWRVQLDTYRPEVARYGGPRGVLLAEQVFRADSDAVLAIVVAAEGEAGLDARWRLAVCGVDRLLADAGWPVAARREAVRRWRDGLLAEHGVTGDNAHHLAGTLFRKERAALEGLLDGEATDERTAAGLAALNARSAALAPLLAQLDGLDRSAEDILGSYSHMYVNRLLRAAQRTQELVVYDLLDKVYASRLGRAKAQQ